MGAPDAIGATQREGAKAVRSEQPHGSLAEQRAPERTARSADATAGTPAARVRRLPIRVPAVVFALMFAINALNYFDRFLVVAAGPTIKAEFHLRDREIGLLSSAFLLVYTLAAVPLGLLGDRLPRARVVGAVVALWSVASAATGFVSGFRGLFATRAAVGLGEAGYYPAGTALLSVYYPLKRRARVMSRWGAGQLVGIALAFIVSAWFAHWFGPTLGWRRAFLITGPPGLALAGLMWLVAERPHARPLSVSGAAADPAAPVASRAPVTGAASSQFTGARARIGAVLRIRTVWLVIVLQAFYFVVATPAVTFLPIYMRSPRGPFHIGVAEADILAGTVLVVGGLTGVLLGGNLADWLTPRVRGGRVMAAGLGFCLALPCYTIMLLAHSLPLFVVSGTLAVLALNIQAGPLTAAVQDAAPPALRATAVAMTLLLSHVLGDVWAPTAVGNISTALHEHSGLALLIVGVPTLAAAAVVGVFGARFYAREVTPDS